jgi:hypothetical protein
LAVPADAVHEYVPPGTGEAQNVNAAPTHTVAAEAVMVGLAGNAITVAVATSEGADWQFTPTVTFTVAVTAPSVDVSKV